ncbi:TonB-dependent receptor [Altericroceibacterium endophyticum]|uniref:TonB-dependent receptor n=1 Tax=Altericroceibacterium endophyticum TaxID=1808508 RepID=A0A6I4T5R7_9SPHN|nr:TonB-dependent receptor [Altericroceibacterium endophyticum]MXO66197.1 TonB-dependent receptor [Altericroceibacterium endophyticum]
MKQILLLASASLLAIAPCVAHAQDSRDKAQTEGANAASPDIFADTIIVTGEKFNRTLQETVASVAVTTGEQLAEQNIQTLQEVYNRTANVSETYGSYGFTIRGMNNRGVTGGGNGALATVYIDGAPMPTTVLHAAPTDTWDVAQVEIFRGPQSTLQGLNALAGAVHVRTRDPEFYWGGRGQIKGTLEEDYQLSFAGGGPIAGDELAFRVTADYRDERGLIYNPTRDAYEDDLSALNIRGKLLWEPEALPGFEAKLGFTHYERDGGYQYIYADLAEPDYFDNRVNRSNVENFLNSKVDIATAELSYEINSVLSLTSVTSWNNVTEDGQYDGDGTAADRAFGTQDRDYESVTQELRLSYEGDWLSGLLGVFYYNRDQVLRTGSRTLVPLPVETAVGMLVHGGLDQATAQYAVDLYAQQVPNIIVDYASNLPSNIETMAIFGDANIDLTSQLTLIAGFRYDHERNTLEVLQTTAFAGTYPNPADYGALAPAIAGLNAGVQGLVDQAGSSTPKSTRNFDAFLPKVGLDYTWSPRLSTAVTIQRGYRSGGTSANTARSLQVAYNPEYIWNYEFSLRSQPLDGVRLNANAFYIDWTDQQVSVNFGLNNYDTNTVNAGKSHLYGFEVEFTHSVNYNFDWYASVGHVKTKFDEFTVDQGSVTTDLVGAEFAYAPEWTLAAGANVRSGDFTGNINASYRSSVFSTTGVDQVQRRVAERTVVNAKLGYNLGDAMIYVFANNLLDEGYIQYVNPASNQAVLGAPRIVGLGVEASF